MRKYDSKVNIINFLNSCKIQRPCLVIDLASVKESFKTINNVFSTSDIYYAVKANSAPKIIKCLHKEGSNFDVVSKKEIQLCLSLGIKSNKLSYGSTLKKSEDIAWAYKKGISLYVFDAEEELIKIAKHAPGSKVFCRLQVPNKGANWPLSNKFGCSVNIAKKLIVIANKKKLKPVGLSFHVGSQQTNIKRWSEALDMCKEVYFHLKKKKINIEFINIGGGIPIDYLDQKINLKTFSKKLKEIFERSFTDETVKLILEPGRALVGPAGIIESEIILVSKNQKRKRERWVYLDIGRFNGLAETEGESIRYEIATKRKFKKTGPVIIAGPSCDGADILFEKRKYNLPLNILAGDKVRIFSAGAYTSVYSSDFNGSARLKEYFINGSKL